MNALLIYPDGHCRVLAGTPQGDPAILAVLAQGALAAGADIGVRAGQGACLEMNLAHARGGTYLLPQADGGVVMIQYGTDVTVEQIREAVGPLRMPAAEPPPMNIPGASPASGLGDALNTTL